MAQSGTDLEDVEELLFEVAPAEAGERLDAFLAHRAGEVSRSRLKALVKGGSVAIGGRTVIDPNYRVNSGETVGLRMPEPEDADPTPEPIPLEILYEDNDLVVIDKPAGLVVHPGPGNWSGTLVNALLHHCGSSLSGIGGVRRPGIVHRLDKDTSGLLVVAKNDATHRALAEQFADHGREGPLEREYLALVWGVPARRTGTIETALDRDPRNRQKQAVVRSGGRRAITHYAVEEVFGGGVASLVRCALETGRTHQIRVHLAHIGHPLVGDLVYGSGFLTKAESLPGGIASAVKAFRRQALHAARLAFRHPTTGAELEFESPPPADMAALLDQFRGMTITQS
ncbi:RluA family pseudouridine synthase [Propylenella binzhouense]|uniref:Pseudouridine synthase n=1 Tax=Propylenella binzhouense TaxID=2555902 RepID=A0A964T7E7_9HYPH|nr:RluA family pseudouridine synthase [Propylenella binzhouense]MYZ49898.1 RluA family pseudouridine synthase [Propylenella binzhouense]